MRIERRLRYADLLDLGVVRNRATLRNWILHRGFPEGQLTGPGTRTWAEDEVALWIENRPTAPKATPVGKWSRRKRKAVEAEARG
jgi:hypothetical protein